MRRMLLAIIAAAAHCAAPATAYGEPRWRDPFARPTVSAPTAPSDIAAPEELKVPELRAILYDQARSLVDIDGRVLVLGDSVAGFKLVQVDERSVRLVRPGKSIRLTLIKETPQ